MAKGTKFKNRVYTVTPLESHPLMNEKHPSLSRWSKFVYEFGYIDYYYDSDPQMHSLDEYWVWSHTRDGFRSQYNAGTRMLAGVTLSTRSKSSYVTPAADIVRAEGMKLTAHQLAERMISSGESWNLYHAGWVMERAMQNLEEVTKL